MLYYRFGWTFKVKISCSRCGKRSRNNLGKFHLLCTNIIYRKDGKDQSLRLDVGRPDCTFDGQSGILKSLPILQGRTDQHHHTRCSEFVDQKKHHRRSRRFDRDGTENAGKYRGQNINSTAPKPSKIQFRKTEIAKH